MRTAIVHMIIVLLITVYYPCRAQNGMYLPPQGEIAVYEKDTVAVFCNVINEGRFGSLKGAVINFYGSKWENGNNAFLPDENYYNHTNLQQAGGTFRFLQVSGINRGAQYIYGGYSAGAKAGASFPNLSVANKDGLQLQDFSDLKIRYTLQFERGHILLNGWNLVVGERYPGNITGYSDKAFVVTGKDPGGGFLYREQVNTDSMVVFPVGAVPDQYSPLAIKHNGNAPQGIHARVFDSVYQQAISGNTITTSYVMKTWNIGGETALQNNITVWLQYNNAYEGSSFTPNRDSSYVTLFAAGTWDTLPPTGFSAPGKLTTGIPAANSYINKRTFANGLEANTYLAVAAYHYYYPAVADLFFEAYRQSKRQVTTRWHVRKEVNLLRYELERRRENEDDFYTVAKVAPHNYSGSSNNNETYYYNDDNLYDNWTYYRLKIYGKDGSLFYSAVKPVPWLVEVKVFPTPSDGNFKVTFFGIQHKLRMEMHDMQGKLQGAWIISGDTNISRTDLPAGIYILTFYDVENNSVVNNVKIEIL